MKKTARVIDDRSAPDTVGLYDIVRAHVPSMDMDMEFRIVTTVRNDFEHNLISKESPFGRAVLGKKVHETAEVDAPNGKYTVEITEIIKAEDDESAPLNSF